MNESRSRSRDRDSPPSGWLVGAIFLALACLLLYPLYVPYQAPDQDHAVVWATSDLARGEWTTQYLPYTTALPNLLRLGFRTAIGVAHLLGRPADAIDVLIAAQLHPQRFRLIPRSIAILAGLISLATMYVLCRRVMPGWSAIIGMTLLGTCFEFVREHHHGNADAPASAALLVALACATRYAAEGRSTALWWAAVSTGVAASFKQTSLMVAPALLAATVLAPAPLTTKVRAAGLSAVGGLLVAILLSYQAVLQFGMFLEWNRLYRAALLSNAAFIDPNVRNYGWLDVIRWGLGIGLPLLAGAGILVAMWERNRLLLPTGVFVLCHVVLLANTRPARGRYLLPLVAPVVVLAAFGLGRILKGRPWLGVLAGAVLSAIQLRPVLEYLRLIGTEDTRVTAARWLESHVAPGTPILLSGHFITDGYTAPDIPQPLKMVDALPSDMARQYVERLGPVYRLRTIENLSAEDEKADSKLAQQWRDSIVVVPELTAPELSNWRGIAPAPALRRFLENNGVLLVDLAVEKTPGPRMYEPSDLNLVPLRGGNTLLRPGPRIQIWRVTGSRDAPDHHPAGDSEGRPPPTA